MAIATTTAVIAGVAIAASLASAGMAYYGQQQQAASAERLANYNFAVQKQQMEMQARMQGIAADQQYQAGLQNASAMENQALRVEQEARERAKRMRSENERLLGEQRARFGKAGVTSTGTPLAVMAESAGLMELAVNDELYKADMERSSFYRKAEVEKWQAGYSLIDKAAADYNFASSTFRANPILLEGQNTATALRTNSYGSLISGVADAASIGSGFNFGGGKKNPAGYNNFDYGSGTGA
jgi:hypothetical protein